MTPFPCTIYAKQDLHRLFAGVVSRGTFFRMFNRLKPHYPATFRHYSKHQKIVTAAQAVAFIIHYQSLPAGYFLEENEIVKTVRNDANRAELLPPAANRAKARSKASR